MKNKFKPSDFIYDPIEQPKRPLWMHTTVQQHRTSKTTFKEVVILVGIFAAIVIVWSILA